MEEVAVTFVSPTLAWKDQVKVYKAVRVVVFCSDSNQAQPQ
jgi:hypothetical protein